ncbi:MAG: hypothetical protein U0996_24615 [Planctomycetaceae bacterium]
MSNSQNRLPEPSLPEHELLQSAGRLPTLSAGIRERVLTDCSVQIRNGRRMDQIRIVGSLLAACLLICVVWTFRWNPSGESRSNMTSQKELGSEPARVLPQQPVGGSLAEKLAQPTEQPVAPLPKGGVPSRPESLREVQQLNQLIEQIRERNNNLCGWLPYL